MTRVAGPLGLFRTRLRAFTRGARRIDEGDIEAVHRTRVASRRLRELLPVMGLDAATTQKLCRRVKKITKRLGVVRELDVLMLTIQALERDDRYSSTALKTVAAAVENERVASRQHVTAKLSFKKIERLDRRLRRATKQREWDERGHPPAAHRPTHAWVWALEARVARHATGVRSAIETAGTVYVPERLHDVRIAIKKLRYAMELGADARSQQGSPDISILKAAQDSLGRLHDLEILIARARHAQASLSLPTPTEWRALDSLIDALEDDCRGLHAHYLRHRARLVAIADRAFDTKGQPMFDKRRAG
jgi:CHAD domain-containing protein